MHRYLITFTDKENKTHELPTTCKSKRDAINSFNRVFPNLEYVSVRLNDKQSLKND